MKDSLNALKMKIAVIDSGVNVLHPDLRECKIKQYGVEVSENGYKCTKKNTSDCFGHGTACAWIVHRAAPEAEIISIQVLDKYGVADHERIIAAIDWCINERVDVICLSMGSCSHRHESKFYELGERAVKSNVVIVTAMHEKDYPTVPAMLPNYIGVYTVSNISKDEYVWNEKLKRAGAYGRKQRVGWNVYPYYAMLEGTSFATAHMAAIIAKMIAEKNLKNYDEVIRNLRTNAKELEKVFEDEETESVIEKNNCAKFRISHATIFGYTKEMDSLIKYQEMTGIQIDQIVDFTKSRRVGTEVFAGSYKYVVGDYKKANIIDSDTLIISKLSLLSELLGKDIVREAIEFGISNNQNIYSLEYIDINNYADLYKRAEVKNLKIRHPMIGKTDLSYAKSIRRSCGHLGTDIPILGIFGTGTSQGKFTLQLELRKYLAQKGYFVKNLGTEMHSELFGFESYYPMEILQSIKFSQWDMLEFLQGEVRRLEIEYPKPDIIIVGSQSGTIPKTYAIESAIYTLPSISFLMGTVPHAYCVVINHNDDEQYVKDTIKTIELIGKGKVICVCISNRIKERGNERQLEDAEKRHYTLKWRKKLGLPVHAIYDIEKITETIFEYFS